jgi:hypothetical protein
MQCLEKAAHGDEGGVFPLFGGSDQAQERQYDVQVRSGAALLGTFLLARGSIQWWPRGNKTQARKNRKRFCGDPDIWRALPRGSVGGVHRGLVLAHRFDVAMAHQLRVRWRRDGMSENFWRMDFLAHHGRVHCFRMSKRYAGISAV